MNMTLGSINNRTSINNTNMKKYSKILFLFISLSICININQVKAQWTYYMNFSTSVEPGLFCDFTDVNFVSPEACIYGYSHYWSPSSGTSLWLRSTVNSGNAWNNIYSSTDQGISTYEIETVRDQSTYFHIRNWQGFIFVNELSVNGSGLRNVFSAVSGYYLDFSAVDTSQCFLLYSSSGYRLDKYLNGIVTHNICTFNAIRPNIIFFADSMTGYIAASNAQNSKNHLIQKSVTSGTNWVNVFNDSSINIRKMFFVSANVGFATGDSGKMIKTTDGGTNWQYLNTGTISNLNSLYFLNESVGFAAGDSGIIINTTDGGNVWHKEIIGTQISWKKIFFFNDSIGIATCAGAAYITNLNSPTVSLPVVMTNENKLSVYPIPTKESLTIETPEKAIIEILNINGQIIKTINNAIAKTFINVSSFTSGIYIIKVKSDKEIVTKKFIKQ